MVDERKFPEEYSKTLARLLKTASIGPPNVVGSSADFRSLYSADYDMIEKVIFKRGTVKQFQRKIKSLSKIATIVDIKCGEIEEWNVINTKTYSQKNAKEKLTELWQNQIITNEEFKQAEAKLKFYMSGYNFLKLKKELRFGVLRWTPEEVQQGYKTLRNNQIMYLENAMKSTGITKVDAVAWEGTKYVEVSNIILFTNSSGKPYAKGQNITEAIKNDILVYSKEKNWVKVLKRMILLAKRHKNMRDLHALYGIINSPIGALYSVLADLEVIHAFKDATTPYRRNKQLDQLKNKLAHLYYPQLQHMTASTPDFTLMKEVLQKETYNSLKSHGFIPIPQDYRKE